MQHVISNEVGSPSQYLDQLLLEEVLKRGLTHSASTAYLAEKLSAEVVEEASFSWTDNEDRHLILSDVNLGVGNITFRSGYAWLTTYSRTSEKAESFLKKLEAQVPKQAHDDNSIPVKFWYLSPHGPTYRERNPVVPGWDGIETNYNSVTRNKLINILNSQFRPGKGGQLILWHGEPGTGKTTALRALAWEWRDWCEMHYITDPDRFFGTNADYMINVLTDDHEEKWRLLILEDTGELLQADAKKELGQALSRMLNAVDGLIGQGLKFLILVTTNEELGKLHPAITRPGRCLTQTEFNLLNSAEAAKWLKNHGVDQPKNGKATIADLYSVIEDFEQKPHHKQIGFSIPDPEMTAV